MGQADGSLALPIVVCSWIRPGLMRLPLGHTPEPGLMRLPLGHTPESAPDDMLIAQVHELNGIDCMSQRNLLKVAVMES